MKPDSFVVLVVDDDSMTRNVIAEILRDEGITAEVADGFQSALGLFAPGKYNAVILDNQLGDGLGVNLCRRMKEIDPAATMFLFAGASEAVRLEALACGVVEVMQKPYDLSKLAYLIKREMRREQAGGR
jgi:DNA-binding response OmpR family regulator